MCLFRLSAWGLPSSHHRREVIAAAVPRGPVALCVAGQHNAPTVSDRDRVGCIVFCSPALCSKREYTHVIPTHSGLASREDLVRTDGAE